MEITLAAASGVKIVSVQQVSPSQISVQYKADCSCGQLLTRARRLDERRLPRSPSTRFDRIADRKRARGTIAWVADHNARAACPQRCDQSTVLRRCPGSSDNSMHCDTPGRVDGCAK